MNFFKRHEIIRPAPHIGLGMAAIGRPAYINIHHDKNLAGKTSVEALLEHSFKVLDTAYDNGVRYFDAARSYGRAEKFLADWIEKRGLRPDDLVIGSKWGYTYVADWRIEAQVHEIKEHSLKNFNTQWMETHQILGDFLNLYQIHSATLSSGVLGKADVLDALRRLKEKGIGIGLTVSGTNQKAVIRQACEIRHDNGLLFDSVQATWNLLERAAEDSLREAHRIGIAVIIKETLANGRLTDQNDHPDFSDQLEILTNEAKRLSSTVDALAISAVLAQPWVDIVLSGAARETHVKSNLKAYEIPWDEQAEETLKKLREDSSKYWQKRSQMKWK